MDGVLTFVVGLEAELAGILQDVASPNAQMTGKKQQVRLVLLVFRCLIIQGRINKNQRLLMLSGARFGERRMDASMGRRAVGFILSRSLGVDFATSVGVRSIQHRTANVQRKGLPRKGRRVLV
eukprot:3609595-Amphidinium_carterae.1